MGEILQKAEPVRGSISFISLKRFLFFNYVLSVGLCM